MKVVSLAATIVLLGTGLSFAGAGAPVPEGSQTPAKCESVWRVAAPSGDTLSKDKAVPYVINFQMVDTDNNGSISQSEFKTGCEKGWVQQSDAATAADMKAESQAGAKPIPDVSTPPPANQNTANEARTTPATDQTFATVPDEILLASTTEQTHRLHDHRSA